MAQAEMKLLAKPSANGLCPAQHLWPPPGDSSLGVWRLMVQGGCRSRGRVVHILGSLSSPPWSALGHGQQHKREERGMPALVNCALHTGASLFYESESEVAQSCLTLRPHGPYPTRLLHPWNFSGKRIGVGCRFLLQWIFLTQGSNLGLPHCR